MPTTTAAADILEWAQTKLDPWQRDSLRRLASTPALAESDIVELMAMLKQEAGYALSAPAPAAIPVNATHLGAASAAPEIRIKAVRNIRNVNKLAPTASVTFLPEGLTVIYGTNGSGKTGFIRILRRACRTRVSDAKTLRILGDVYGAPTGPTEAEIVVRTDAGEQVIPWKDGDPASELMLRAAVFDSKAAELYVDEGNQIRFLPFGLALPHKLNELSLALRAQLEAERKSVQQQLLATRVDFPKPAPTGAQTFYKTLKDSTTDEAIAAAVSFTAGNDKRLAELEKLLAGSPADAADRRALAGWLDERVVVLSARAEALGESRIENVLALQAEMTAAKAAADLAASDAFAGEPLPGVGSETWRRLWEAARLYSTQDAYPSHVFPITAPAAGTDPRCVLCHQALDPDARARLERFEAFISGTLATRAVAATEAYAAAADAIAKLDMKEPKDTAARLKQVKERVPEIAALLAEHAEALRRRHGGAVEVMSGQAGVGTLPALPPIPQAQAAAAAAELRESAAQIEAAALDEATRARFETERLDLSDSRLLFRFQEVIKRRRDLLKEDALYEAAIGKTQTQGITKRANELIDKHLTAIVKDSFAEECEALDIGHLSIGLSRESNRKEAVFKTDAGTRLVGTCSAILSEGEQRALALAGFLTEARINAPDGPIIIDDPVSSLDRQRSLLVAKRLVEEAGKRQVIVFTHDLVFYNELCRLADEAGLAPHTYRIFRNDNGTGLVDPSGGEWKGMKVSKRIGLLKNDMATVSKLHNTEPGNYEYHAKNIYSRLRDAYERAVEEWIFKDTITRFDEVIKTQNLRYVSFPDELALRFHAGMTKANTFSHDNPSAGGAAIPKPEEIVLDIGELQSLIEEFKALHDKTEKARSQMKSK